MAGHYINTVENEVTGKPVNGATVKVYVDGATIAADGNSVTSGTLATIYSDDGVTPIVQASSPLTTGSDGEFDFYTAETRVVIAIIYDGEGRTVWNDVDILGGTVSSDVTALATRVSAAEVITLDATIVALAAFNTNGLMTQTAANTFTGRTITGTANELTVTNGDGVSGNPTLSIPTALTFSSKTITGGSITPEATPTTTAIGYLGSPQMSDQDDYTLVMSDAGKHYYHVSATPHTLTIPANASVAFPIGTVFAIVNENGAGALSLAITTDTLRWGSSTGTRTIAANGTCSLIKVAATVWRLTGDGIT